MYTEISHYYLLRPHIKIVSFMSLAFIYHKQDELISIAWFFKLFRCIFTIMLYNYFDILTKRILFIMIIVVTSCILKYVILQITNIYCGSVYLT